MALEQPLIEAGFGTPRRQNRWTVAFRLILAIPHFFVVLVLGIAAFVVTFAGWFAALVTGRLPRGMAVFLADYITYVTRAYSYFWLMNDRYPPFNGTSPYEVNLDVGLGPVRRLAVLFRIILLIPAGLLASLATAGASALMVFIWLIVLVAGQMPAPLFGALGAVLRFEARYYGYAVMLTDRYPGGLMGDQPTAPTGQPFSPPPPGPVGGPLPPPVPPFPTSLPPPAMPAPSPFQTPPPAPTPASVWAPGVPLPAPPPPPSAFAGIWTPPQHTPRTDRLVLSAGAKRIVAAFLVVGAIVYVVEGVVDITAANNRTTLAALVDAHNTLGGAIASALSQEKSCTQVQLQCAETYQSQAALAFDEFYTAVASISFPASDQALAGQLESDSTQVATLLRQLSSTTDPSTLETDSALAQSVGNRFDTDYANLASALT